jgi:CPA1 family monovalent cation:H+ antiporter
MRLENVILLLFTTAAFVALIARRLKVPYPIALVLAGGALGATHLVTPPHLTRELLYTVFLPGLVFEGAFHLDVATFRQVRHTVLLLAVPGVVLAMLVTGALLGAVGGPLVQNDKFGFPVAFVFAALIAATDPIAVIALFKTLGAPRRLAVAVEAESLINDGTAVLVFGIALQMATSGRLSIGSGVVAFLGAVIVGGLIGAAFGFAVSKAFAIVDDPLVEITLTTIAAYGSFGVAEQLRYSGIIATLVAGMVCGSYGAVKTMRPTTRVAVQSFWSYVAFALNSLVFLLLGFEARGAALLASWKLIGVAYLTVVVGRAAVVYTVTGLLRRSGEAMPWSWAAVLTWGGMRGALSMVLALAIPSGFPGRQTIITMTLGVVAVSIIAQGLTATPLLRRLRLVTRRLIVPVSYERALQLLREANSALSALEASRGDTDPETIAELRAECLRQIDHAHAVLREARSAADDLRQEELIAQRREVIEAERRTALACFREGVIAEDALDRILEDLDQRLARIAAEENA